LATGEFEIVVGLQVQPELRAVAEIQAETERGVGADPPPLVDNLGDAVRRDADRLGELVLRQPVFLQELLAQHLTRRDRRELVISHGPLPFAGLLYPVSGRRRQYGPSEEGSCRNRG
jgi:hypothetical protein